MPRCGRRLSVSTSNHRLPGLPYVVRGADEFWATGWTIDLPGLIRIDITPRPRDEHWYCLAQVEDGLLVYTAPDGTAQVGVDPADLALDPAGDLYDELDRTDLGVLTTGRVLSLARWVRRTFLDEEDEVPIDRMAASTRRIG